MELGSDQERDGAVKSNFVVNAPSAVTLCGSLFGDALSTSDPGGDQLAIFVCCQAEIYPVAVSGTVSGPGAKPALISIQLQPPIIFEM